VQESDVTAEQAGEDKLMERFANGAPPPAVRRRTKRKECRLPLVFAWIASPTKAIADRG